MPHGPSDMPDDQLMLAYARGDAAAFDELYARHEGALFRFVRRMLGASLAAQADEVFRTPGCASLPRAPASRPKARHGGPGPSPSPTTWRWTGCAPAAARSVSSRR